MSDYRHPLSSSDRRDLEELRQARKWWRRPDPFDPRNRHDDADEEDTPSPGEKK